MSERASSGGIGLGGAIFIVFLVLKLTGHITWSWWWVTAPLWGTFAVFFGILGIGLCIASFATVVAIIGSLFSRRKL